MGFNFPSTPAVGDLHPVPAQVGLPQYRWDGTMWVTVVAPTMPRYQRVALAGLTSVDVQVPADATTARLSCVYTQQTTTSSYPMLQLSVSPGVFRTSVGDYQVNGYYIAAAGTIMSSSGLSTIPGMIVTQSHENNLVPAFFDGSLLLKRRDTNNVFVGDFRGANSGATGGWAHSFYENALHAAPSGSALSILALRLTTSAGITWGADSYLNVEWL